VWILLEVVKLVVMLVKGCIAPKKHLIASEFGTRGVVAAANAVIAAVLVTAIEDS
jgi:hypothetical protein